MSVLTSGTLANIERAGFVRTPPWISPKLRFLLNFQGKANVLDPAIGQGDLVGWLPKDVSLYGVELNSDNAVLARQKLPNATIFTCGFESMHIPDKSQSIVIENPPYMQGEHGRMECDFIVEGGKKIVPGGIGIFIIPARTAMDKKLATHLAHWYERHMVFKFPNTPIESEDSFYKYTQIVYIGVRRTKRLKTIDRPAYEMLMGYHWHTEGMTGPGFDGGKNPPELPDSPIPYPYDVPVTEPLAPDAIWVRQADDTTLLEGIRLSGAHLSTTFVEATNWDEKERLEATLMPYSGASHIASAVLASGTLNNQVIYGPDNRPTLFSMYIARKFVPKKLDEEQKEQLKKDGVVEASLSELEDISVLGQMDMLSGDWNYVQGDDAFSDLVPWLSTMAKKVIDKYAPIYQLNPPDWMLEATFRIGEKRTLAGADFPGMAAAQQHAVCGKIAGIDTYGKAMIQGEPGTGKTIIAIGSTAVMSARWQKRLEPLFRQEKQPAWVHGLRRAWLKNPRTLAMLHLEYRISEEGYVYYRNTLTGKYYAPEECGPRALPVLISTPKKVTKGYQNEILGTFPDAEVMQITTQQEIVAWFERCAVSHKKVVFGIIPHSLSRAFSVTWEKAVHSKKHVRKEPDLHPSPTLLDELEPVEDLNGKIVRYEYKGSGATLMKKVEIDVFRCPDCGKMILSTPGYEKVVESDDDDAADQEFGSKKQMQKNRHQRTDDNGNIAVTAPEWFKKKPRYCSCRSTRRNIERYQQDKYGIRTPLWSRVREKGVYKTSPQLSFSEWTSAMETFKEEATQLEQRIVPYLKQFLSGSFAGMFHLQKETGLDRTFIHELTEVARVQLQEIDPETGNPRPFPAIDGAIHGMPHLQPLLLRHLIEKQRMVKTQKGKTVRMTRLEPAVTQADEEASYRFTTPYKESVWLYEYLYQNFRGCIALTTIDESHNGRGKNTDIGRSHHLAMLASQAVTLDSATHTNGDLKSLYSVLFRFDPQLWLSRGYGWDDAAQATKDVGAIQQWKKSYEVDARHGSGVSDEYTSFVEAPGMSANIIIAFLKLMVFITVMDVGASMPPLIEYPVLVSMEQPKLNNLVAEAQAQCTPLVEERTRLEDERRKLLKNVDTMDVEQFKTVSRELEVTKQMLDKALEQVKEVAQYVNERDLAGEYANMCSKLYSLSKDYGAAVMQQGTMPSLFAMLPCDKPHTLSANIKDNWNIKRGSKLIYTSPVLAWDHLYPAEKKLQELVKLEIAKHHRIMIYVKQTEERSMPNRLKWVLKEHADKVWALPNKVDSEDRQDAIIEAVEQGRHIVIVANEKVNEGVNLQHAVDTIIWYEMPKNLMALDQASRRAWRLNKSFLAECKEEDRVVTLYYMAYTGSKAHKKMMKLGAQSGAASLFAGEPIKAKLAIKAGADQGALARISSSMVVKEDEDEEEVEEDLNDPVKLAEAFARRSAERNEKLKEGRHYYGFENTLHQRLVERWAKHYAENTQAEEEIERAKDALIETVQEAVAQGDKALALEGAKAVIQFGDIALIEQMRSGAKKRTKKKPSSLAQGASITAPWLHDNTSVPTLFDLLDEPVQIQEGELEQTSMW